MTNSTTAWRSPARWLIAAALLGGCSGLDPNIGAWRTESVDIADAGMSETSEPEDATVDPGGVSFAHDIRPLMNRPSSKTEPKGCKNCHYRTEASHVGIDLGGVDLTTLGSLRRGGGSSDTRIVVPRKPAESVLVQVLRGQYPYSNQMPKNGLFWTKEEIELVEKWITEGAKGADGE